jgi:hypothetical protein
VKHPRFNKRQPNVNIARIIRTGGNGRLRAISAMNATHARTAIPVATPLPCFCHVEPYHVEQRFDVGRVSIAFAEVDPTGDAA